MFTITDPKVRYDVDVHNQKILLGSGTFGRVYSAIDRNTNTVIAVKEISLKKETGYVFQCLLQLRVVHYITSRCIYSINIMITLFCSMVGKMIRDIYL